MNSIFKRRSIRKYNAVPVEHGKIEKLLRAAMQAPSAGNQRPWEFLVVENPETLDRLSNFSPYARMLNEAPLAIIVMGNKEHMRYPESWEQDLGAACQNLLLEAVELELGAVWLGTAPIIERTNYIKELFMLPDNIMPYSVIVVGYSDEENKFVDRFDLSRVHYEDF